MIMYDDHIRWTFPWANWIFVFPKYLWRRLGYVLASSLVSRKLFRPHIDQHFSKREYMYISKKTRNDPNDILPWSDNSKDPSGVDLRPFHFLLLHLIRGIMGWCYMKWKHRRLWTHQMKQAGIEICLLILILDNNKSISITLNGNIVFVILLIVSIPTFTKNQILD